MNNQPAEITKSMKTNGFGERLKSIIKEKKLTQASVAKGVGTSIPSVNRWTKGGEIEYDNLRALADYLGVNWVWLRYGDEAIESLHTDMPDNAPMRDSRREYLNQILESEARMKAALDMAEVVTWEWNVLTGSVQCSDNATALFDVSVDNLPNCMMPFMDLPIDELITLFGQNGPHKWDFEVVTEHNESRWFASRAELIFDSARRPIRVIGISADITARKQAENALQRSEYMLKKIIDIIPVGLWVADETGQITLANPEVQRMWGGAKYVGLKDYDEYKGWWEKTGEPLGAKGWTLARAVKEGETSKPEIVNIEAFDGQHRTIIMHATPLRDQNDNIIGAIEINQDITETKDAERDLKQSLTQWRAIFEQNIFSVIQLDQSLHIINLSQKARETLKSADTALTLENIFTTETCSTLREHLEQPPTRQLYSATIEGAKLHGHDDGHLLHVIHDARQDTEPLTLIFIF